MKKISILSFSYVLVIFSLLLYSYTQVDLSLTLSRVSLYQTVEKAFQYIGWFQRPISTWFYVGILFFLFCFYARFLYMAKQLRISKKQVWVLIGVTTLLLTLSYNAFSYDLFNYIFDAKIVTHYHQNPYLHKALDYPGDPMLSFMRWTHRTYPYGPVWLILTVPLSFVGFQYFLPTFFIFKIFIGICFLASTYTISKIFQKLRPDGELFGIILFAFNPLVLIESLISAHNDIVAAFFALTAFYFLTQKKHVWSGALLLLSIGIKFDTVFLFPVFFYVYLRNKQKKKIDWDRIFLFSSFFMFLAILVATYREVFQPWYILFSLPYMIFIGRKKYIFIPLMILSVFSLLQYAPFLFYGDYNYPVNSLLAWLTYSSWIISIISVIGYFLYRKYMRKNSDKQRNNVQ